MRLRNYLRRLRQLAWETRNRTRTMENIFTDVYRKRLWANQESVSGSGSTLYQARNLIAGLPGFFLKYGVNSVLDIPCGDFNWMSRVDLSRVHYYGADIVADLIKVNQTKYPGGNMDFLVADIRKSQLPSVDLILCRDCLVHFSNRDIGRALKNICSSNSKYLLTTTFPEKKANPNIVTGSWRPLNLELEPFRFGKPVEIIYEDNSEINGAYADKAMGLWDLRQLSATLRANLW